jgi:hypothetical protein
MQSWPAWAAVQSVFLHLPEKSMSLTSARLNILLTSTTVLPVDTDRLVDDVLGLAVSAFDSALMTEQEFRTLSAMCLDKLADLKRQP